MNTVFNILFLFITILTNTSFSSNTTYFDVRINYDKTKEIVLNCLNELLNILKLNNQVKQMPKVQLLLIMHENLNAVVQYKWKVTVDIKNIIKAENFSTNKQIYKFVDEAMTTMETDNLSNKTETNAIERNLNITQAIDFFSDLFNRINKQSITMEDKNQINVKSVDKGDIYEEKNEKRMNDVLQIWEPEEPHNETRRLYGGRPVDISQYPFITSVHVLGKFSCAGSIISSNFVITAASCLQPGEMYKASQRPIEVRIGSDDAKVGGKLLPALEVVFHPQYDPVNLVNNLALIKVKEIHHANDKPMIKKIRMDSLPKNFPSYVAKGVFILGWGDGKDVMSTMNDQHLTSAFLDLQSLDDCIDIYTGQYVTDKNFCAGLEYKGSGACYGDIGGPAIVLGTLVGIVSFGPPACGTVSDPTVFTNLGYYTTWINDVMNEKVQKSRPSDRLWLSDTALSSQQSSVLRNSHEEMLILRQLVHELDQPGNRISEIIEEDQELDDEMKIIFQSTTPGDVAHHILLNRSVVLIPGLHIPAVPTEAPMITKKVTAPIIDIGLPDIIPYDQIEEMHGGVIPDSVELRYFVNQFLTKGTLFKAKGNVRNPQQMKILASVETNENFEYDSTEGLSIEVPPEGVLSQNKDLNTETGPKESKVGLQNEEKTVFDLGEQQHIFNIGGKVQKMLPRDVWFEVKRLRQKRKGVKGRREYNS